MKPWVKVWRPRQGSAFEARVSGPAKILFRGLLPLLDEEGSMALPKRKEAYQALGCALGYDKNERRSLRAPVASLVHHGCLLFEQDADGFWTMTAPSWAKFQDTEGAPRARRRIKSSAPSVHHESNPGTPSVQPEGHELVSKCPESHEPGSTRVEGEKEEEGDGDSARARDPDPVPRGGSPSGRWRLFWARWLEAFPAYSEPMVDLWPFQRTMRHEADFDAELGAFLAVMRADEFRPDVPHRVFGKSFGDWQRRRGERRSKRNMGPAPVSTVWEEPTPVGSGFEHLMGDRGAA